MKLLANENISGTVVRLLRERGHDVLSAKESMRSAGDEELLARAQTESRLVITHDKDFGELAFRWGLTAESGVVLLRLSGHSPDEDNQRVVEVMESHHRWTGHFTVVTDDRIRIRPLGVPPKPGKS